MEAFSGFVNKEHLRPRNNQLSESRGVVNHGPTEKRTAIVELTIIGRAQQIKSGLVAGGHTEAEAQAMVDALIVELTLAGKSGKQ